MWRWYFTSLQEICKADILLELFKAAALFTLVRRHFYFLITITCFRHGDGLSCWHGVKHTLTLQSSLRLWSLSHCPQPQYFRLRPQSLPPTPIFPIEAPVFAPSPNISDWGPSHCPQPQYFRLRPQSLPPTPIFPIEAPVIAPNPNISDWGPSLCPQPQYFRLWCASHCPNPNISDCGASVIAPTPTFPTVGRQSLPQPQHFRLWGVSHCPNPNISDCEASVIAPTPTFPTVGRQSLPQPQHFRLWGVSHCPNPNIPTVRRQSLPQPQHFRLWGVSHCPNPNISDCEASVIAPTPTFRPNKSGSWLPVTWKLPLLVLVSISPCHPVSSIYGRSTPHPTPHPQPPRPRGRTGERTFESLCSHMFNTGPRPSRAVLGTQVWFVRGWRGWRVAR